ncbi:hypothetical protein [Salinibacterium sp. ZJ450]|uniref:hypothetical protein n=1 Tax=Salinibacterium sp. ZJ450 TaxID=2708338 RepID=UPI001422A5B0|nr:hypothetical protein [Salinibacterium sp. ZJ450]
MNSALENTLGAVLTKRGRTVDRIPNAVRAATANGATLGTAHLALGGSIVAGLQAIFEFGLFLVRLDAYPRPELTFMAWGLFLAAFVSTVIVFRTVGEQLPSWLVLVLILALGGVVALDFMAIWSLGNIGGYASASVAAGFGLLTVVTVRQPVEVIAIAAALGTAFIAAIVASTPLSPDVLPTQITVVSLVVMPAVVGVLIVRGFRRMVQVELDRVLVQSTVSAPRYAVGMLASEELARLDLAAEKLLESVATGQEPLPLTPATASTAASLATELRLHLIEGRRETWLHHAVSESEFLGRSVTLVDKGSLAGLLDPAQRDGLLAAVWLLLSDSPKATASRSIRLELGPVTRTAQTVVGHRLVVPVVMTIEGVSRNRIDPAAWGAIGTVGQYTITQNQHISVNIECLVDNPASH